MRRKMLKSAISIGIAAAMAIGLCACGKSEADAGGEMPAMRWQGRMLSSAKFLKPKN